MTAIFYRQTHRHKNGQTDGHSVRQTGRQEGRQAGRQTHRQTGRQTLLRSGGITSLLKCACISFLVQSAEKKCSGSIKLLIILLKIINLNSMATFTNIECQYRDCCLLRGTSTWLPLVFDILENIIRPLNS